MNYGSGWEHSERNLKEKIKDLEAKLAEEIKKRDTFAELAEKRLQDWIESQTKLAEAEKDIETLRAFVKGAGIKNKELNNALSKIKGDNEERKKVPHTTD